MNALFDTKDNLYGYVSMYSLGKTDKKSQKFEYVILDKNLNPVANKEFEAGLLVSNYFGYVDFKGQIILRPSDFNYLQAFSRDAALPVSTAVSPAEVSPPTWRRKTASAAVLPIRRACTAAPTPPGVPP